jgi:small subunit ribosomal protein S6
VSNYELVYIISPAVTEENLPGVLEKVTGFVTKAGGTVTEVAQWGKKKLAYSIKRFSEGNYVLARIAIKPSAAKELESSLKMSSEIIRHLLIKTEA